MVHQILSDGTKKRTFYYTHETEELAVGLWRVKLFDWLACVRPKVGKNIFMVIRTGKNFDKKIFAGVVNAEGFSVDVNEIGIGEIGLQRAVDLCKEYNVSPHTFE